MHSVNYARLHCNEMDRIVISTEDQQIKELALQNGVDVIDRPNALSDDEITTSEVLKHVANSIGDAYDTVILLQATNPLRPKKLLQECISVFNENKCDSLFTVSRYRGKIGTVENNKFKPFNYFLGQRSQTMDAFYFENGLIYMSKLALIKKGILYDEHSYVHEVDHPFAYVDIDDEMEFKYAQFLLDNYPNE